jgi:hypothetical protein
MSHTYHDTKASKEMYWLTRWRHGGRWWKRQLAKAYRQLAKRELAGDFRHARGLAYYRREVNWRLW